LTVPDLNYGRLDERTIAAREFADAAIFKALDEGEI